MIVFGPVNLPILNKNQLYWKWIKQQRELRYAAFVRVHTYIHIYIYKKAKQIMSTLHISLFVLFFASTCIQISPYKCQSCVCLSYLLSIQCLTDFFLSCVVRKRYNVKFFVFLTIFKFLKNFLLCAGLPFCCV